MAIEPIVFTDDELTLIRTVADAGQGWDCPEFNPLRGRIKQFYLEGQDFRCCYCQKQNPVRHGRAWDVEHVISRTLNAAFLFEPENLAVSCIDCNLAKLDADILSRPRKRFPRRADAYTIVHPHFDSWADHFLFGDIVYTPLTAKGAETIKVCKLYRFYAMLGKDALFTQDKRYVALAEGALFAKTPEEAEPSILAMRALIQEAKDGS
jgi:hypothetical protein